jgi:hypothetical protein
MNMNRDKIFEELNPFCDIGEVAKVSEQDGKFSVRMTRDARPLKLIIDGSSGKIQATWGGTQKHFSSISAMLGSEIFANLRRWADSQGELLKRGLMAKSKMIEINATTHDKKGISDIQQVSSLLNSVERANDAVEILLIDGAAGIGKTSLIEQLARERALSYKLTSCPLILHVKSRGRVLSNIQDLMAFSLQTLRSTITYDQLPILIRHGLVIVAIDGFDELGDPNGYDVAWAQLSDLIRYVRGRGTIILSGRDTFMGRSRLINDVEAIRNDIDVVIGLTLVPPMPEQAKDWLRAHQWSDRDFELPAVSVLLEENSFALRPVFLKLLGENVKPKHIREKTENHLMSMLVDHMIDRESKLFGKAVDAVIEKPKMEDFLFNLLHEAARDMADSQTESLDENTLSWIAEAALGNEYPPEILGLIKNRSNVVAFFVPDERPAYRRFINSHLMNFFLARVTIDLIVKLELPKYIRRNLIGSEFLSVLIDVLAQEAASAHPRVDRFIENAIWYTQNHSYVDRGVRNLGAILLAALPHFSGAKEQIIVNVQIDEGVVRGTAGGAVLKEVMISQLDCRGADLGSVIFENVTITSLIADDSSRFSDTFPIPTYIHAGDEERMSDLEINEKWLNARGRNREETSAQGLAPISLSSHGVYKLLGRACRIRQYWLRAADDIYGERILNDKDWPLLRVVLLKHGLLREEIRGASGRSSDFYHIRQKERILAENKEDEEMRDFYTDLAKKLL